jgi:hypothetical protein
LKDALYLYLLKNMVMFRPEMTENTTCIFVSGLDAGDGIE